MSWIMSGIFFITCYPILLIMYFMLKNAANRNGLCFGATLKQKLHEEAAVKDIAEKYLKDLKRSLIIMAIIPIPFVFIPYFSISMSLWMIWILAVCFVPCGIFAVANTKIKELKQERGWNEKSEVSYADLKLAAVPGKVKLITFLPTLILSTIPVIIAFMNFKGYGYVTYVWIMAMFAVCTYLFYACAVWADKQKITVICEDSNTNVNYARAKKQVWKNFSLARAWVNTIFTWVLLYLMFHSGMIASGILWSVLIYCVLIIAEAIGIIKKLYDINNSYASKRTLTDESDDDTHWLWGLIYYNKNDKHFMIESRLGTGTTINLGNKAGMITTLFSAAVMLLIPILCVWMIMVEFTPIQVSIEENTIICEQLRVEYEIPLSEIDSYEIVTKLPEFIRVAGTGMDDFLSGTYEVYREGMYELFLNPQNDFFIKIVTDEFSYYISGEDNSMTQQIVDALEALK